MYTRKEYLTVNGVKYRLSHYIPVEDSTYFTTIERRAIKIACELYANKVMVSGTNTDVLFGVKVNRKTVFVKRTETGFCGKVEENYTEYGIKRVASHNFYLAEG